MRGCLADFHTYIAEHFYQYVNILYVGNIAYFNLAIGQKHGAYHLKSFVFRALRGYFARKFHPSLYPERTHSRNFCYILCKLFVKLLFDEFMIILSDPQYF